MTSRIMYIENKSGGLVGPGRIGRVTFSQTGRTLYYRGLSFCKIKGFKANHLCVETGEEYWISGPKRNGEDGLYGQSHDVTVDPDVRDEYWTQIRRKPLKSSRAVGRGAKYSSS